MKTILVIGCGGLGGFVVENLGRMRLYNLVLMDGDKFDSTNLNRQIGATIDAIGKYKAETLSNRVKSFGNPYVAYHNEYLSATNSKIMDGVDLVIDCTDTIEARLFIESECAKRGIVYVHGGVDDTVGQCFLGYPDEKSLEKLYAGQKEVIHKTYSYAVSMIASIEVILAKSFLDGKEDFRGKIILVDLESLELKVINK